MTQDDAAGLSCDCLDQLAIDVVDLGQLAAPVDYLPRLDQKPDDAGGGGWWFVRIVQYPAGNLPGKLEIHLALRGRDHLQRRENIKYCRETICHVDFINDVSLAQLQSDGRDVVMQQAAGDGFIENVIVVILLFVNHHEATCFGELQTPVIGVTVVLAGVGIYQGIGNALDPVVVQVDDQVGFCADDGGKDGVGDALGDGAVGIAGKTAIKIFIADADVTGDGLKADGVHHGESINSAAQQGRFFQQFKHLLNDHDAAHFIAMDATCHPDHRAGDFTVDHHHGQTPLGQV